MVIVMDDEDRENEGDLCMAAEKVTPEAINFMATEGRGLICLPLMAQKLAETNKRLEDMNARMQQTATTRPSHMELNK